MANQLTQQASRIDATFARLQKEGRKGLIPFVTAGDPDPALTVSLLHTLVTAGADVLELGVPFSDPMADGPTIQRASERALAKGVSLRQVIAMVREFRQQDASTPVVLMGYANPIEAMGVAKFAEAAAEAGVDGVLVVDYPPEESAAFSAELGRCGLAPIFLLAPTSGEERMAQVAGQAKGYIYYVSLKGVTGAKHLDMSEVASRIPLLKERTGLPVGVGFGIRDGETARQVAQVADAVVIGSRIIEEIEHSPADEVLARVQALVSDIRQALDRP